MMFTLNSSYNGYSVYQYKDRYIIIRIFNDGSMYYINTNNIVSGIKIIKKFKNVHTITE